MTKKPITAFCAAQTWRPFRSYILCGFLLVLILLLDLAIPLGVAIGVLYVVVVLVSLESPYKHFTIFIAIFCSILTIGAFLWKPPVAEPWKVLFNRSLSLFVIWSTATLGLQRKRAEEKRENELSGRERALKDLRILRGFLPICASCKKIRNSEGYWTQLEEYISAHSEADFSHGLCQDCANKLYPEFKKTVNPGTDR
jgi:membrane-bound ClpP family serine protease